MNDPLSPLPKLRLCKASVEGVECFHADRAAESFRHHMQAPLLFNLWPALSLLRPRRAYDCYISACFEVRSRIMCMQKPVSQLQLTKFNDKADLKFGVELNHAIYGTLHAKYVHKIILLYAC